MKHLELEEKRFSDVWGITGVSLIGVLLLFYPGDFNKALETYPDELRYYSLARSILNGKGLDIRGINYPSLDDWQGGGPGQKIVII